MNREGLSTGDRGRMGAQPQEIDMPRTKALVPDQEWVKPEDKQKRELQSKHEGPKNGHAKPAPYRPAEDDDYNPMAGG